MTEHIRIIEVGPRDGLQNEARKLTVDQRVSLIHQLAAAGLHTIEAGAMVSPKRVPQMAESDAVLSRLTHDDIHRYPVLVPNLKGLDAAIAAGARDIAVFGSASETFSQRNIQCSITESLRRFESVIQKAHAHGIRVRGYVSCVVGCPYEGDVPPQKVAEVASELYKMGCEEISLGDTIGVGTPDSILTMLDAVSRNIPIGMLAGHYHDTRGMALANIYASLRAGVHSFDASCGGLGGCPYAQGASGNVATEEVVYLLHGLGYQTGIELSKLVQTAWWVCERLGTQPHSKLSLAMQNKDTAVSKGNAS